jgi:DNA mismatch repair protein MSH5
MATTMIMIANNKFQIASVGALLDYLVRQRALSDLEDEGIGGLDIRNIETLALFVFPPYSLNRSSF